ncbi:Protein of unknown function [Streptomyces harbinensis]|uniref:DUF2637 domain-containing protein n=1 Tax=Streptomyces harbinensis TaxID=1176198 RepID=A0A1I6T3U4_9ACTN|nr:Protein of unknown function [Streptomyces harbinensis]
MSAQNPSPFPESPYRSVLYEADDTQQLLQNRDGNWQFDGDLAQLLQTAAPQAGHQPPAHSGPAHAAPAPDPSDPSARHRRPRRRITLPSRPGPVQWLRWGSLLIAAALTLIAAMLSVLGGVISYQPLRDMVSPSAAGGLTGWWPVLIYGPWLVASLSIVRAALHQRRAAHSWAVVIFFSGLAVYLCVEQAPKTVTDLAVAGLPPISALVAFHQLVRQITLINPPRHAIPQPRGAR